MWLCFSILVSPVTTLIIAQDVLPSVSITFSDANIWLVLHSPHIASTKKNLKWVWCHRRIIILLYSAAYSRNVGERGRREAKRFMKLPLKVSMGFTLRLHCCEDLRLISFRCCLAWVWLWEGTHICCHYQRFGWLCLEEQNCLCAYLLTDFVWLSAPANWQHAACSNTNGKLV